MKRYKIVLLVLLFASVAVAGTGFFNKILFPINTTDADCTQGGTNGWAWFNNEFKGCDDGAIVSFGTVTAPVTECIVIFANLPVGANVGDICSVTDSPSITRCDEGGATGTPALCIYDGVNWNAITSSITSTTHALVDPLPTDNCINGIGDRWYNVTADPTREYVALNCELNQVNWHSTIATLDTSCQTGSDCMLSQLSEGRPFMIAPVDANGPRQRTYDCGGDYCEDNVFGTPGNELPMPPPSLSIPVGTSYNITAPLGTPLTNTVIGSITNTDGTPEGIVVTGIFAPSGATGNCSSVAVVNGRVTVCVP